MWPYQKKVSLICTGMQSQLPGRELVPVAQGRGIAKGGIDGSGMGGLMFGCGRDGFGPAIATSDRFITPAVKVPERRIPKCVMRS